MKSLFRVALPLALILSGVCSTPAFAERKQEEGGGGEKHCSERYVFGDGSYGVKDCWGKTDCGSWTTPDKDLIAKWKPNAELDGACVKLINV